MSQTNKLDIGLNEIRDWLVGKLAPTHFRYRVFISEGEYVKAYEKNNQRVGTINALMNAESTNIMVLGGGLKAVSMICSVSFLVPVNDNADPVDNVYPILEEFRECLNGIFPVSEKVEFANGHIGSFAGGYPVPGMLMQRQYIGKSMEYTCTFEVAYLKNAINSSGVQFFIKEENAESYDEDPLPVAAFSFNRRSTIMANLYSNKSNGEAETYAESSAFGVDLSFPAISPTASGASALLYKYVVGEISANTPLDLKICLNDKVIEKEVIFGEASYDGGGIDNISMRVSFVPYVEAEEIEG